MERQYKKITITICDEDSSVITALSTADLEAAMEIEPCEATPVDVAESILEEVKRLLNTPHFKAPADQE